MKFSRFSLRRFLLIVAIAAMVMAFVTDTPHIRFIALFMTNNDIQVDPADGQLQISGATSIITMFGEQAHPALVGNLDDPHSFAAAHVALTKIDSPRCLTQVRLGLENQEQCFHRMPLRVDGKGTLLIDFEKQPPLKRWWQEYHATQERREAFSILSGVVIFGDLDLHLLDQ